MSEFIEKRREQSIREYEFMKQLKLFTETEIQAIKNKRFQHEHKVERRAKELADFISYIVYENDVLAMLEERRRKLGVKDGRHSLERSIQNRIKALYKRALDRFSDEYRLWTHYLQHCERVGFLSEGSRTLDRMLNFHGDKPKAWTSAANWEYRQNGSLDRARHFSLRGIQRHPTCRELYLNYLEIQLKEIEKIASSIEGDVEEQLEQEGSELYKAFRNLELVYENYSKKDKDLDFFIELLNLLKHMKVANKFGISVLQSMKDSHASNERMWQALAQLALEGSYLLHGESKDISIKEQLELCVQVYETSVETLPTKSMWSYYIDKMMDINQDMTSLQKFRRKALGNAFRNAFATGFLEEDKYVQYLKLLINTDNPQNEQINDVLSKALSSYPRSTKLYTLNLNYLIRKDAPLEEIEQVFDTCLQKCSDDLLSIWIIKFQYFHTRTDLPEKLLQTFREAIQQTAQISHHFQPMFLEFLALTEGIDAARKEYQNMQRNCQPCLDLHRKMAYLESIQAQPSNQRWRNCHENATQLFGQSNPEVWLDFLRFERERDPKKVPALFERAKSKLDGELLADFVTKYELERLG
ncbi:U3 small nucleolar RNA-associated protein 6 homolog [Uranotaenia lowii]|uniref:U3 small nucleolar RNA-associated protein 6 homolog n=1 Tax=Uranotaenia lowii TaxID=190385 RepID=UPI002479C5C1|nr:U3 small nucleolar RNA-associated protein 6 homolog [Uranotaenia lowii]XP_055593276.1 U3 small nucleolar RNA-associated protein 6 homolog [Uranotaenia lowii]